MRVILKTEVRGLGRPGDVKDVADGYARNFLLPKGLAIEATGGELKHLAQSRDAARARKDKAHEEAEELAKRLAQITLVFKLKAGDQGKTFGSVTSNLMTLVKDLGANGLVGLIALGIILWLFSHRKMA